MSIYSLKQCLKLWENADELEEIFLFTNLDGFEKIDFDLFDKVIKKISISLANYNKRKEEILKGI